MNLEKILSEIQNNAAGVGAIGNSLKFDFGDGDHIHIDGTGDANIVTTENKEADCTVKVTKADLIALASGDLNPMMAFMGGKIKVDGDMGVAMKLQSLLG